jgi:hypothetical protein
MNLTNLMAIIGFAAPLAVHGLGGGGPIAINEWHGRAQVRAVGPHCVYRAKYGGPVVALSKSWQPLRKGEYIGEFLLRTGSHGWVHLNGRGACVDSNSLVAIESAADIGIQVKRGRISAADGKRGPAICRAGGRLDW